MDSEGKSSHSSKSDEKLKKKKKKSSNGEKVSQNTQSKKRPKKKQKTAKKGSDLIKLLFHSCMVCYQIHLYNLLAYDIKIRFFSQWQKEWSL